MPKVIWITGAAGFSARHLAANLRRTEPGSRLIGLDRNPAERGELDDYHAIDITNLLELKKLAEVEPPRLVFHLAAAIPPVSEEVLWHVNVGGTRVLIEAVASSVKPPVRVLVTSSAAVYRPTSAKVDEKAPAGGANAYGRSKWGQEQIALASGREFGVGIIIARTFNLLGPGLQQRLLAGALCAKLREPGNEPIPLGNLSSFRDFIDVRDAVEAYRLIATKGRRNQIYNVCSGHATRSRTLVRRLAALAGKAGKIQEDSSHHSSGVDRSLGDPGALMALGWQPAIPLQRTLRDMLAHPNSLKVEGLKV
jgi:GDP-4-dehydro-6-deoxy-D-mannose reductase